jgi:hypothetical protein
LAAAIPGMTSAIKETATASRRNVLLVDNIGGRFVNTSSILLFGWSLAKATAISYVAKEWQSPLNTSIERRTFVPTIT